MYLAPSKITRIPGTGEAGFSLAPGSDPDWGRYPAEVESWVKELQQLPLSAPYEEWMLSHPDGRIYIGYRAGTYIVDRAMKTSGHSAAELVHTTTDEILKLSGIK